MKRIITLVMALILCFNFTGGVSASAKKKQQENYTIKYKIPSYLTRGGVTNPNPNSYSVKDGLRLHYLDIPDEYHYNNHDYLTFDGWYQITNVLTGKSKKINEIKPGTTGNIKLEAHFYVQNSTDLSAPKKAKLIKQKKGLYFSFSYNQILKKVEYQADQAIISYTIKNKEGQVQDKEKTVTLIAPAGTKKIKLPSNTIQASVKLRGHDGVYTYDSKTSETITI